MKFSLIHPSRSRPHKSFGTISDWLNKAGKEIELIVSIDEDDPNKHEYIDYYSQIAKVICSNNNSAVGAINIAAKESTGDILIVVSDDFQCPRNWAMILEKHLALKKDFLLKVNDGTQQYIVTLPIMDRAYYNRFGYIYYPGYQHMFCDTELTHVADILKRLVIRNDLMFKHNHYSVLKQKRDEISVRADSTWEQGKKLYLQRVRGKFGLDNVNVMSLCGEGNAHREWLRRAGL